MRGFSSLNKQKVCQCTSAVSDKWTLIDEPGINICMLYWWIGQIDCGRAVHVYMECWNKKNCRNCVYLWRQLWQFCAQPLMHTFSNCLLLTITYLLFCKKWIVRMLMLYRNSSVIHTPYITMLNGLIKALKVLEPELISINQ